MFAIVINISGHVYSFDFAGDGIKINRLKERVLSDQRACIMLRWGIIDGILVNSRNVWKFPKKCHIIVRIVNAFIIFVSLEICIGRI